VASSRREAPRGAARAKRPGPGGRRVKVT